MKLGVTIWLLSIALLIEAEKIAQNQTPKYSRTAEVNGGSERKHCLTMSEVNGNTLSISFRIDEGLIEHNNRIFIANIVNGEQVQENITYVLLCAVGGVLLGTGLGAVSNQVLKRTGLV